MICCFRVTHVHDFGVLSPPHDDKMLELHEQLYIKLPYTQRKPIDSCYLQYYYKCCAYINIFITTCLKLAILARTLADRCYYTSSGCKLIICLFVSQVNHLPS